MLLRCYDNSLRHYFRIDTLFPDAISPFAKSLFDRRLRMARPLYFVVPARYQA